MWMGERGRRGVKKIKLCAFALVKMIETTAGFSCIQLYLPPSFLLVKTPSLTQHGFKAAS